MKKDMPLEGLRWSRDSGSALYDTPQNGRSRTGWGVVISVKMKNYLDISLNALQAIGTATRKEQTSAHAWHISTPSNPKK